MGVHKRDGSQFYQYKFKVAGRTYRGSTGETNKAKAQQVELDERRKVTAPPDSQRTEVTLGAAADGWLETEGRTLADAKNNESRVRKLFGECMARAGRDDGKRWGFSRALIVHHLTNKHIAELEKARRAEGNSHKTINREIALLQSILRYARLKLHAKLPPELDLTAFKTGEGKGRLRFLTLEEERRLLDELDPAVRFPPSQWAKIPEVTRRQHQDQYDLAVFLLDTGGRYGEGAGVMRDVVDLEAGTVNLYRDKVGNEGTLALTKRLRAVLVRRFNTLTADCPYIFPGYGADGGPRKHATKGLLKAMERAGINAEHLVARFGRATPAHTLRHTFASRLVPVLGLYKVSKLLGHSSVKTTEIYAHLQKAEVAHEAAAVLDQIHAPKPVAGVTLICPTHDKTATIFEEGAQKRAHAAGTQQEDAVQAAG